MHTVDQHFEFHRLARTAPGYRWWKPLLTALLGVVFYLVFTIVVMVPAVILAVVSPTGADPYLDALTELDLSNPVVFAIAMVSLILLIPALALATLITGPRPIGLLSSIAGRIRWRWLLLCSGAALAVFLVSIGLSLLVELFLPAGAAAPVIQQDSSTVILLLALSLLVVPFQAAAEEYVFRGFLMQTIGGWLRHPAFAILLPVPLFVLGHGYDPLGQVDVAVFAVFAGWITWRTGGLEAAIAVHAVNNVTIFVLGAVGLADVNATGSSLSGLIVSVLTMAVTTAILVRLADRRGIGRTRVVTPQPQLGHPFPPGPPQGPGNGQYPYPYPAPQQEQANPWRQGPPSASAPASASNTPQSDPWHSDPWQSETSHPQPTDSVSVPSLPAPAPAPQADPPSTGRSVADPTAGASERRRIPHHAAPASALPTPAPATTPRGVTVASAGVPHPSGPAHPPGTAFPPGEPHPSGPGHPGPVPPAGQG